LTQVKRRPAFRQLSAAGVGEHQVAGHHFTGVDVRAGKLAVDLLIEGPLAERDHLAAPRDDGARELRHGGVELGRRHHAVDEAPGQRRRGVDRVAGQEHLHHALSRDVAADADRRRRAEHADAHAGQREPGAVGGDGKVRHRDELATRGGRDPVDARDHRLRKSRQLHHHPAARVEERALPRDVRMRAELLQVMPCAKALAFGRQHHDARGVIARQAVELGLECCDHVLRQRIEALAAVQRQRAHAVARRSEDERRSGGLARSIHTSSYSIALVDLALSRRTNFWIFPVDVFGSSQNTTFFGALKRARCCWQCAMSSASVTAAPGFVSTNAHAVSPHLGSGCATTAAASTAGWR
jgi:hypothetical protein